MIDRETWITLAERCAVIIALREEQEQPEVKLVFDSNDQAHLAADISREWSRR
jgi:hypothetical protein